ncbi:MAG: hypothetical protein JWQ18_1314 [Conexibacter sp.]|nr:hypothetical protein [Conexibacter sp.]
MSLPLGKDFATLRAENSLIDAFFERRENDPRGGEDGERVSQVRSRPAFKLTYGRMRGATWLDGERPPQAIVWLLGAEKHDDRHKGRSDAYDILGRLDEDGELFPTEADRKRLELDRRRRDSESFLPEARQDARRLVANLRPGQQRASLSSISVRIIVEELDDLVAVHVAVSAAPVIGRLSGERFPLTQSRFLALQLAMQAALEEVYGPPALLDELRDTSAFPGGLGEERPFVALVEPR